MNADHDRVVKDVVHALRHLLRAVYVDGTRMQRSFGVTGPQGVVLRHLRDHGPTSAAQLSRILHVTPSNMTGLVDRLEVKGLVERIKKEGDRRVAMINLTPAGGAFSRKLPDPLEAKLLAKLSNLEPGHAERLSTALHELLAMVETTDSVPSQGDLPGDRASGEQAGGSRPAG